VPDHPSIEAKPEFVQERKGDPFMEYSLPDAILKLRQGVGSLIRTKTDHGIIDRYPRQPDRDQTLCQRKILSYKLAKKSLTVSIVILNMATSPIF